MVALSNALEGLNALGWAPYISAFLRGCSYFRGAAQTRSASAVASQALRRRVQPARVMVRESTCFLPGWASAVS